MQKEGGRPVSDLNLKRYSFFFLCFLLLLLLDVDRCWFTSILEFSLGYNFHGYGFPRHLLSSIDRKPEWIHHYFCHRRYGFGLTADQLLPVNNISFHFLFKCWMNEYMFSLKSLRNSGAWGVKLSLIASVNTSKKKRQWLGDTDICDQIVVHRWSDFQKCRQVLLFGKHSKLKRVYCRQLFDLDDCKLVILCSSRDSSEAPC